MRKSNDPSESEPTDLGSLGVLDLDLTVCPDVFGLRAFDEKMPVTRMLPGSGPCDLRLLIPDAGIGQKGFHDVVIENLLGITPTLAYGCVSGDEGAQCRDGRPAAKSLYG